MASLQEIMQPLSMLETESEYLQLDFWMTVAIDAMILVLALLIAKVAQVVLLKILSRTKNLFGFAFGSDTVRHIRRPFLWILLFLALSAALPLTHLPELWVERLHVVLRVLNVATFGWLIVAITYNTGDWLEARFMEREAQLRDDPQRDSMSMRRYTTQVHLLRRVAVAIIVVLTGIGIALVIPGLREFGMSMFASAGVAGIVIGLASKTALSNLIAGIQLALSQPILLGDLVKVQGQTGTVEEITSSYVVVRMWDMRRVIVPLNVFLENPFENWTYHEPELFEAMYIYVDYNTDIDALRAEAKRYVEASKFWNGSKFALLVNDTKDNVMEIRINISGRDAGAAGDLVAELRENLVKYLQSVGSLPQPRIHLMPAQAEHNRAN